MSGVSVITLNKGRDGHLVRLLEGLARGTWPSECIVVQMGAAKAPPCEFGFPVREVRLDREGLPLAEARNRGRAAAKSDALIFLDVDCIPSANLVTALGAALTGSDGLICCEIRYLPAGAVDDDWSEAALDRDGFAHPARTFPAAGIVPAAEPGSFWSLAFAVGVAIFDRLGGFDSGFVGYGAEDTDLAFRAAEAGVPVLLAGGARAFHQHHSACDPPLQHFADIVRNARRFRARHGVWPMAGWLDAFAKLGLIASDRGDDLHVLRLPSQAEIEAARLPASRPF